MESSWALAVIYQVKLHVHGFEALCLDVVVDNPLGCDIVCLKRGAGLQGAHFGEEYTDVDGFAGVYVEPAKLCLGGNGHNGLYHPEDVEYGAVVWRVQDVA